MPDFFPIDYFHARTVFCELAAKLGARLERHTITARGPQQEPLSIDVALLGAPHPQRCVVVTSGLHGVEAFFGSAVQCAWLDRQRGQALAADQCVCLVHALNPYGFAWVRRADENNVDLNRNYLAADEVYRGAPDGYSKLDRFLNPRHPPRRLDPFRAGALLLILRHGVKTLKDAVAVGQYEFPRGLFYGGSAPAQSTRIVQQEFSRWMGSAEDIVHIDFHSGLGEFARHRLLSVEPAGSPRLQQLQDHFGNEVESVSAGVAYLARGLMSAWLTRQFADRNFLTIAPEFGTYPVTKVLAALRAENQAHFYTQPNTPVYQRAKRQLLEALCPANVRWRTEVVRAGLGIIDRGLSR